jgi:4-hydroxy-2-oxoheptanedioate aldolase
MHSCFQFLNICLVTIVAPGLNIGAATHSKSHIAMPESMTNSHLRVLNALRAGTKPITTFMGLPSFRTAQIVAQTGVDVPLSSSHLTLLFTDNQKGYYNRLRAWAHQRRFHAQCHSHYRRGTHSDLIKRALDAGAQ